MSHNWLHTPDCKYKMEQIYLTWLSTSAHCRRMPGGEMEAVVITQDHKPNLEQQRGAARLAQQQV